MSEYFHLKRIEHTDNPDVVEIITSESLVRGDSEVYSNREAGENGSTLAQTLFHAVDGIHALIIMEDTLIVTREPGMIWESLVDEIRNALRDFFF